MSTRWLRFGIALSGWRTLAPTVAAMIAMGVGNAPLRADVIELRGSAPSIDGDIVSVGPGGIEVRTRRGGLEQQQSVAWSDVRDVRGANVPKETAKWLAAGDALWRGRMRVARGDWIFALDPMQRAFRAWDGAAPSADGLIASAVCAEALRRSGRAEESLRASFEAIRIARAGIATGCRCAQGTVGCHGCLARSAR